MKKPVVADALTAFAEALESIGIAPADVEVLMPLDDWQGLARRLDDEMPDTPQDMAGVHYLIRYR
jgi:extradiol dioxygenase family protein